MLNGLFITAALASVLLGASTGQMQAVTDAMLTSARSAVDLAIGLVGVMAFFLGLMQVAQDGGLMAQISRAVSPVMRLLFPSIPAGSPAMSAMVLNISANMLGLGNAATPFGIKAIEELDKYNTRKGTATNAMVVFLAVNTAGLALLPSGVIGVRAALGSSDAAGIWFPTWFASACATVVGVTAALLLARLPRYRATEPLSASPDDQSPAPDEDDSPEDNRDVDSAEPPPRSLPRTWLARLFWLTFLGFAVFEIQGRAGTEGLGTVVREMMSYWALPTLVAAIVLYGWVRKVRVYHSLVEGAKQGFQVALRIIPFLVAILVVIGMFRASGGLELIVAVISPLTALIGMPGEALPMALLRPLSGSGALGVASEAMTVHGPDSLIGYMVSTYQGSTETTFYTLAVYFGAIGVKVTRHTVPACLLADITGILAATFIVNLMYG
jgi:spore maturation protein SpmA